MFGLPLGINQPTPLLPNVQQTLMYGFQKKLIERNIGSARGFGCTFVQILREAQLCSDVVVLHGMCGTNFSVAKNI